MTAVEWLVNKLNLFNITKEEHYKILCQIELEAKELEKQQIIGAYENGNHSEMRGNKYLKELSEQYYKKTFNK